MSEPDGWRPDPSGMHEYRLFAGGQPTPLVSNGGDQGWDPLDVIEAPTEVPVAVSSQADWYPDPTDPSRLRYWDGSAWTSNVNAAAPSPTSGNPTQPVNTTQLVVSAPPTPTSTVVVQPRTNGLAVASLVLGLVPVIPVLGSILAVVFGGVARIQISESSGRLKGSTMAAWGIVLGLLGTIGSVILIVVGVNVISAHTAAYQSGYQVGVNGAQRDQDLDITSSAQSFCSGVGSNDYNYNYYFAGCVNGFNSVAG